MILSRGTPLSYRALDTTEHGDCIAARGWRFSGMHFSRFLIHLPILSPESVVNGGVVVMNSLEVRLICLVLSMYCLMCATGQSLWS